MERHFQEDILRTHPNCVIHVNLFICMCALVSLFVGDKLCVNIMISRRNFSGQILMNLQSKVQL